MDNEKFVRSVYQIAEDMDIPGFIALFTDGSSRYPARPAEPVPWHSHANR